MIMSMKILKNRNRNFDSQQDYIRGYRKETLAWYSLMSNFVSENMAVNIKTVSTKIIWQSFHVIIGRVKGLSLFNFTLQRTSRDYQ